MKKTIISFFIFWNLMLIAGVSFFHVMASMHHDKAEEMFNFAGAIYESPKEKLNIVYDNFIDGYTSELFRPLSSAVTPSLFNKEYMVSSGLKAECGSLEYLKLLRDDIDSSIYEKSHLCCLPNLMSDMLPMVLDEREDRALIMCGISGDAHVISLPVVDFNKLLNVNVMDGKFIDIRDSDWK